MILLTPGDYKVMPWKNGLGMTTEIHRADGADGEMDWRVSIASVATEGPFSPFPGYDRRILAIGGKGMVLDGGPDGAIEVLPSLQPRSFSGDWTITARLLDGPVTDFNLIARRSAVTSRLDVFHLDRPAEFSTAGNICLAYALSGCFEAAGLIAAAGCSVLATLHRPLAVAPVSGLAVVVLCTVAEVAAQ